MANATLTPSRLRPRWRRADPPARRELIIETAMDLLNRKGLRAVTMRRVARRLGVGAMTLYTYVAGRDELRRAITRRGFERLHDACQAQSTLGTAAGWRGGARAYVRFAVEHPHLYELMFSLPYFLDAADREVLEGGFRNLLDRVAERYERLRGLGGEPLRREARTSAGRLWIALHGLASLAIAGRLTVLAADLDGLLDDLLPRVRPDDGR